MQVGQEIDLWISFIPAKEKCDCCRLLRRMMGAVCVLPIRDHCFYLKFVRVWGLGKNCCCMTIPDCLLSLTGSFSCTGSKWHGCANCRLRRARVGRRHSLLACVQTRGGAWLKNHKTAVFTELEDVCLSALGFAHSRDRCFFSVPAGSVFTNENQTSSCIFSKWRCCHESHLFKDKA